MERKIQVSCPDPGRHLRGLARAAPGPGPGPCSWALRRSAGAWLGSHRAPALGALPWEGSRPARRP
eukprot:3627286-Alexandrium_andersonii.AAC.1